jgi:hypothetical protein
LAEVAEQTGHKFVGRPDVAAHLDIPGAQNPGLQRGLYSARGGGRAHSLGQFRISGASVSPTFKLSFGSTADVVFQSPAIAITNTYQTYSFGLDELTLNSGVFSTSLVNAKVDFLLEVFGTGSSFGADSGNRIVLDNFALTQSAVPEPATYATIAGALMLGAAVLRRRRRNT